MEGTPPPADSGYKFPFLSVLKLVMCCRELTFIYISECNKSLAELSALLGRLKI